MKCLKWICMGIILLCSLSRGEVLATDMRSIEDLSPNGFYVSEDILYIADGYTNQIFTYDGSKLVAIAGNENIQGTVPTGGYIDGIAEYTLFDNPYMAVPYKDGVLVSDTNNHVLRFIKDGMVSTFAGLGIAGSQNGDVSRAMFDLPSGLALDPDGNLYVADTGNGTIRMITPSGEVSLYVGQMHAPKGLYWYDGALYATDVETNQILKIVDGVKTVISGQAILDGEEWVAGTDNGIPEIAKFSLPEGIYVDETGIYVCDTGNNSIRYITEDEVSVAYVSDKLADPVAITKFKDTFLIGDRLIKSVHKISEFEQIKTEDDTKEQGLEESDTAAQTTPEVEESQDTSPTILIWAILFIVIAMVITLLSIFSYNKKMKGND